ncbi:MAG TPA: sigma-70 family RNA polymerase sigma factor [Gemmatimonadales bacterium]
MPLSFDEAFVLLFEAQYPRLFRYLDRLSGEPDLAADLAQEAFVRLNQRGQMPDAPELWLVTVALNLFRNVKSTSSRRHRLMTLARAEAVQADPTPTPAQVVESHESYERVRAALDKLPERDRKLLLLQAEGYSYRDIASALELNQASIGTLLARAKQAFREAYRRDPHAS